MKMISKKDRDFLKNLPNDERRRLWEIRRKRMRWSPPLLLTGAISIAVLFGLSFARNKGMISENTYLFGFNILCVVGAATALWIGVAEGGRIMIEEARKSQQSPAGDSQPAQRGSRSPEE